MHDHQADLIVTLTQEGLDPAERASLEAAVAGCPQCLQELDVQRRLAAALQGAKPPGLTELERVRLRREVARQAGIPLGSLSSPPAGRRRRRRRPSPPSQAAAVVAA
ncbi:MAG: hypothetical protein M3N51_10480, partial [Actinomycetota bacterium]|nr:hypothetical protein [Actinomycetota bacterium]